MAAGSEAKHRGQHAHRTRPPPKLVYPRPPGSGPVVWNKTIAKLVYYPSNDTDEHPTHWLDGTTWLEWCELPEDLEAVERKSNM